MKNNVLDQIKKFFRPEFLNRIDGTVVFHALTREHVHDIVDLEFKTIASGLLEKGISLEVTDQAKDWLADKGYDAMFGARPLRRLIQDTVEDKLSDAILEGKLSPGDTAEIGLAEDEIAVSVHPPVPVASA
jgi:ATP-dependent Clp protease ATP-binding subunit ClpC